jgi:predicted permease
VIIILNTLAPVFVLIALGATLRHFGFFDTKGVDTLNRACYWIGLPALLFLKIGIEPAPEGASGRLLVALLGATGMLLISALLLGFLMRQPAAKLATFMHVSFRGNLAYVGLPVVIYAFEGRPHGASASALAATGLGGCVVAYNVIAVVIHLAAQHRLTIDAFKKMLTKTITNPLLLACLAGFAWQHGVPTGSMPLAFTRSLTVAGQFALPLALLCVGSALVSTPLQHVAFTAVLAALLKTLAGPLAGFAMAHLLMLSPTETGVTCLLMATPTAIASYVLTGQLKGDAQLAAGTIALSTVLSILSLSGVIWLLNG